MADPRLTNLYRANPGHQFAFRMVTIAHNQSLACIGVPLSMCFQVLEPFVLDRRLEQLPSSFTEQLFQVNLASSWARSSSETILFSITGASFLFGASSEHAVFFWLQKGCAFLYPVIHNFRL
jgi:hypothetical protein